MASNDQAPKIQIDSDWKRQAQEEKERLAEKTKAAAAAPGAAAGAAGRVAPGQPGAASGGAMPPASFESLISTIATQALFALGAIPDPRTGQRMQSLDLARYQIDLLGILEEKTKGNLSDKEADLLATTAYELRTRYIQTVQAARGY